MLSIRTIITAAILALAFGLAANVSYADPLYASVHVGSTMQTSVNGIKLDDGSTYGAALGTSMGPFRVEAGVDRHNASFASGALQGAATVYNASAFLDFRVTPDSAIYVGGGGDYANATGHLFGAHVTDSGYGYHGAVGVSHRLAPGVIADVQARYTHLDVFSGAHDYTATAGIRFAL